MSSSYNDYVRSVANFFIEEIEKGTAPWQKDWEETGNLMPISAVTGNCYRGSNALLLMAVKLNRGFSDNRWLTYKQAKDLNGNIKKGEHGTKCIYWKKVQEKTKEEGQEEVIQERMLPCPFVVFNADQCEGLELKNIEKPKHDWTPIEAAERILKKSGATIIEKEQNRAYYTPIKDHIVLPLRTQFKDAEGFYSTALHELGHWTGHESRLNRPMMNHFGTPQYAREELRAEISSMMVCSTLGMKRTIQNSTAYVAGWIQALRDDPKELFRACSDAEKIKDFLFDLDKDLSLTTEMPRPRSDLNKKEEEIKVALTTYRGLQKFEQKFIHSSMMSVLTVPSKNPYQLELPLTTEKQETLER